MNRLLRAANSRLRGRGFTLIELLVVIAIISLLTAVVLVSVDTARKNTRDKVRISDLEQAKAAMHIYAVTNQTYQIAGAGSNGQGWFAYEGTNYPESIADELVDLGLMSVVLHDPLVPAGSSGSGTQRQYMNYFKTGGATAGTCLFAHLENPNDGHADAYEAALNSVPSSLHSSLTNTYYMNYGTCTN
jgi:prepilin-type N-terminal cleavage/methylation domain-containing protein